MLKENNVAVFKSLTTKVKLIPFGFIQKAHGLKGEVLVSLDSGEPLEPFPQKVYAGPKPAEEKKMQVLEISCIRWTHRGPLIQFQGCNHRSRAEALKGLVLYFSAEAFRSEHFHLFEILNFLVQIQKEKELKNLGYISHFLSHSHQDLLVVKCISAGKNQNVKSKTSHSKQVEIPFVSSYIQSIDFKEKKIILKLPEGFPGVDEDAV